MATITKPTNFTDGTTAVAGQVNNNFDIIYAEFNGNIDNANIKAAAGIVDTKLAQITTAGKVSATAITGTLGNTYGGTGLDLSTAPASSLFTITTSGVGFVLVSGTNQQVLTMTGGNIQWAPVLPGIKTGAISRDLSLSGGAIAEVGMGFKPRLVNFFAGNVLSSSNGIDDGNFTKCIYQRPGGNILFDTASSIRVGTSSATAYQTAIISSLDADGFTLTWSKTGSPTGTAVVLYSAWR